MAAPPHSDTDDMITELVRDHREVEEMFGKLEERRPTEERQEILNNVITELVRHSVAEEQHLYPTARSVLDDGDSIADHEISEHEEVEQLMKRLESLEPEDAEYERAIRELISNVRHHLEDEEGDLFPRLKQACNPAQLRDLGDKLRTAKATAPTHPHPKTPNTPGGAVKATAPMAGLVDRVRDSLTNR